MSSPLAPDWMASRMVSIAARYRSVTRQAPKRSHRDAARTAFFDGAGAGVAFAPWTSNDSASGSVHRRRSAHSDRQAERRAGVVLGGRSRRLRDRRRARARRRRTRRGRPRDHGPGAHGRPGPGAEPPGGGEGRHPDERAVGQRQQGLPVGAQLDLPRPPDDRRRRRRHRGRRRHGVDDERSLHRRRRPRWLPLRQHRTRRRHHQGRPVVCVRRLPHGSRHRELRRRATSPASSRTTWR